MRENIINSTKLLAYRLSPILIVYLLYEITFVILKQPLGLHYACWISTVLPIFYLVVITVLGYFGKVPLTFVIISQIAVFCCGLNNSYYLLTSWAKSFPTPFTSVMLIKWLLGDNWYEQVLKFLILGFAPMALPIASVRVMLKSSRVTFSSLKRQPNQKTSNSFGSARFANKKEIEKLNTQSGIVIGKQATIRDYSEVTKVIDHIKNRKSSRNIIYQQPVHAILIAPSGYGKGVGVIIPTLLNYHGNVVVTDFKGENYYVTARRRAALGKKVYAFEPFRKMNLEYRCKINVLDLLIPDGMDIVHDTLAIAQLLCPVPQENFGNTKFFQENAGALIQCLIFYVVCSGEVKKEKQNLFKVCELLHLEPEARKFIIENIANSDYAFGAAARLANKLLSTYVEELSGIFSSAQTELRFLDDPYIREATNSSNIDIREIVSGSADLFICMPPDYVEDNPRIARLLTGMIFKLMEKNKTFAGQDKLLMLLDELPAYQYLPFVDKCLNHGRAFNVRLFGVAVSIEKLRHTYPKSWQTFLGSDLAIFCGFTEIETQSYLSKSLGRYTVAISSANKSHGTQQKSIIFSNSSSTQEGDTMSETSRLLLTEDELGAIGDKVIIAFVRDGRPIICHKAVYYSDKAWKGQWDNNPIESKC